MPPWLPLSPGRSSGEQITITALRDELRTFANDAMREELNAFAALVTAQVKSSLEEITGIPLRKEMTPNLNTPSASGYTNGAADWSQKGSYNSVASVQHNPTFESFFHPQVSSSSATSHHDPLRTNSQLRAIHRRSYLAASEIEDDKGFKQRISTRSSLMRISKQLARSGSKEHKVPIVEMIHEEEHEWDAAVGREPSGGGPPLREETTLTDFGSPRDGEPLLKRHSEQHSEYSLEHEADNLINDLHFDTEFDVQLDAEQGTLVSLVTSTAFNTTVGIAIFLNLILIAVETDYIAKLEVFTRPPIFTLLDGVFCIFFVTEVLMRVTVYGRQYFNTGNWKWNIFDCVITGLQMIDTVMRVVIEVESSHRVPTVARIFRYLRFLRVVRAVRIVHLVRDLRLLTASILESMRPLGWILLLLCLMTLMFSILLTMIVADYRLILLSDSTAMEDEALRLYYGSVERSMLSLYQMITDGIHWSELVEPLRLISPWLELVFAAYVALTVLAMMNIILGIFVDSVMRTTEQSKKMELIHKMKLLFEESDADGSGTVDWEEFEDQLQNPAMQAFLKDIDLDQQGAQDLFRLLDVDEQEEITAEDFISGCARMSGAAKAMDLAVMQHESRMFNTVFDKHAALVERSLSYMTDQMCARQSEMIVSEENARRGSPVVAGAPPSPPSGVLSSVRNYPSEKSEVPTAVSDRTTTSQRNTYKVGSLRLNKSTLRDADNEMGW